MEKSKEDFTSKLVDFFVKDKDRSIVIIFTIIGFILRFIAANNVGAIADEMIHGGHSIDIIKAGVLNAQNQAPVWLYLTDISYNLFGVHSWSGRMLSVFFGTLTIPLLFLIARRLFDRKIALLSAFLISISSYTIRYALMEMDEAMIFFVLLSFYYFIKDIEENNKISYLAIVFMGIAVMIKAIALMFIPGLIICWIYLTNSKDLFLFVKKNLNQILKIGVILLFIFTPILAFNYILYEQKGITDVLFSRFFGINQGVYSSLQGYDKAFEFSYLITEGIPFISFRGPFIKLDPLIYLLGIFGIALIFINKNSKKEQKSLFIFHIVTLLFLMGTSLLETHFVSFMPLLSIGAAYFIFYVYNKYSLKINEKNYIYIICTIILISNLVVVAPNLTSKSAMFSMREYAIDNFQPEDIIVVDSRIYRGRIAWIFNDKYYLESSLFPEIFNSEKNYTPNKNVNIYFVECFIDDCGWGTISSQPEFNKSVEDMFAYFRASSQEEKVIYGGGGAGEIKNQPYFKIYKTKASISPRIYPEIDKNKQWFYYPVRWNSSDWYDKYYPQGIFQSTLHSLGKISLWISIILALLSPLILFREFYKN